MFQYAFGRALSMRRQEQLFLDTSLMGTGPTKAFISFGRGSKIDSPRDYALGALNIKAEIANYELVRAFNTKSATFIRKIKRRLFRPNEYKFYIKLVHSRASFFEGSWNNEKYFRDIADSIKHEFTLKNKLGTDAEKIENELIRLKVSKDKKTVSIHVRRGDYISNPYASEQHNIVTMDYYHKALSYLTSKIPKENLKVYIFSDDIDWVKENLILVGYDIEYVAGHIHDYEELHLMSLCDHNIIANSSFSWWGAWLNRNPEKIVIAPEKWIRNPYINTKDVCPPEWIRI